MKDTAILVTTFLRDDLLFKCVDSIRKFYPDIPIFVGDNGRSNAKKEEFLTARNCKLFALPFDLGVGGTRNEALALIPPEYEYIAVIEDDIIFTEDTRLETWKAILDAEPDVGIVSGLLLREGIAEQHYEGKTWIEDEYHHIERIDSPIWKDLNGVKYYLCDLALNVFMMRKATWDKVKWDPQFKTALEHSDFFLRLKYESDERQMPIFEDGKPKLREKPILVAYAPDVRMLHVHGRPSTEYAQYRSRPVGWQLFGRKWNIKYSQSSFNPMNPVVFERMGFTYNDKDENLELAIRILERHRCRWWLTAGTCLGVVREGNFISYDPDIDIGLDSKHLDLWETFITEFKDAGFELYKEWEYGGMRMELSFKRKGIKLDLFFFHRKGDYVWHGVFGPDENGRWGDKMVIYPYVFSARLFDNLKEIIFRGKRCFLPNPPTEYIREHYGPGWRVPKKDYRYWKDCAAIRQDILELPSTSLTPAETAWPDSYIKDRVAIGIKTFMREATFFKTLNAVKENFPFPYKLYVADDGDISESKDKAYNELRQAGHEVIILPFNSGLSRGRNEIARRVKEQHVLMMDDDMELESGEPVKMMRDVLESDENIGLVAGVLELRNKDPYGGNGYSQGLRLEVSHGQLIRWPESNPVHKVNGWSYRIADQVVNFFLARAEMFKDIQWDDNIKVEWEHMDFFLRLKDTKWKAAVCLDAKAVHLHSIHDPEYNMYRRSADTKYFCEKYNIYKVLNRF